MVDHSQLPPPQVSAEWNYGDYVSTRIQYTKSMSMSRGGWRVSYQTMDNVNMSITAERELEGGRYHTMHLCVRTYVMCMRGVKGSNPFSEKRNSGGG